jgi:hypothetical protein
MRTLPSNPYRNVDEYTTNQLYEVLVNPNNYIKPRYASFRDETIEMHLKMVREALTERIGSLKDKLAIVDKKKKSERTENKKE